MTNRNEETERININERIDGKMTAKRDRGCIDKERNRQKHEETERWVKMKGQTERRNN